MSNALKGVAGHCQAVHTALHAIIDVVCRLQRQVKAWQRTYAGQLLFTNLDVCDGKTAVHASKGFAQLARSANPDTTDQTDSSSVRKVRSLSSARYRCDMLFFCPFDISAYVSVEPSGSNTGSQPKSAGPRGSTILPSVLPTNRCGSSLGPSANAKMHCA